MRIRITILVFISGLLLVAGCTASRPASGPAAETVAPEATAETPPDLHGEGSGPEAVPELSGGEVPQDLFDTVLADLLSLTGKERSAVTVVSAEAITWSDGALGCPEPGVMYTQALVDGFQVVFDIDGETYDYHLSDRGNFVLCVND